MREVGSDHRPIKRDPAEFLPKEHLERSDVAMAEKNLGRTRRCFQAFEQVIRAIAAAGTENGARIRFPERLSQCGRSHGGRASEVSFAGKTALAVEIDTIAETLEFGYSFDEHALFHRTGERENADGISRAECGWLEGQRHVEIRA